MGLYSLLVVLGGGIFLMITGKLGLLFSFNPEILLYGALLSFTITITTVICIIGTAYGNVSILVMFATLGQLVLSALYSLFIEKESASVSVFIGLAISVVIVLMSVPFARKNDETEKKSSKKIVFAILCLIVFFTNGIVLIVYDTVTSRWPEYGEINFIIVYSFFAFIICLIVTVFSVLFSKKAGKDVLSIVNVKKGKFGVSLGLICAYAATFALGEMLSLKTTGLIPIVIMAPVSFSLSLILITLFDRVVYKEKITVAVAIQLALAVICSILFAL